MSYVPFFSAPIPDALAPDDLSNLTLWLDASDASTLTVDSFGRISQWDDKSGNGVNFLQSTDTDKPVNNGDRVYERTTAMSRDAGGFMDATGKTSADLITTSAFTMALVFTVNKYEAGGGSGWDSPGIITDTGGIWGVAARLNGSNREIQVWTYDTASDVITFTVGTTAETSAGRAHVLTVRFVGGTLYASLDGGAEQSIAAGNLSGVANVPRIMANYNNTAQAFCNLCEVAVYNVGHTAADVAKLAQGLAGKWQYVPAWNDAAASLSLDFTHKRVALNGQARTLHSFFEITRTTTGSYTDSQGNISYFAPGVLRTGDRGILIEVQTTNICLHSEDFTDAVWVKTRSSITANATTAPDGTLTADKLVEDNSATTTHFVEQTITITGGAVHTFSVYLKASERTFADVQWYNPASPFESIRAPANLTLGVLGTVIVGGGATVTSARIDPAANGWYRVTVRGVLGSATSVRAAVRTSTGISSGGSTYTGDGTSGIFVWGAQVENGRYETSYIPTTSGQVFRTADNVTRLSIATETWFNLAAHSMVVRASMPSYALNTQFARLMSLNDGSANNRVIIANQGSSPGTVYPIYVSGGSTQNYGTSSGLPVSLEDFAFAIGAQANDIAFSHDGATVFTSNSLSMPLAVTQFDLGSDRGLASVNTSGYIQQFSFYKTRLSDATLEALSA